MNTVTLNGFSIGGVAAGIKKWDKKDLGLIHATQPVATAGVFTRNRVQAAPVLLTKARIRSGRCRAVIVNSGNANCCTGDQGMQDALEMTAAAAENLGCAEDQVLVASTGVIGVPMPRQRIVSAVPALTAACSPRGVADFAEAIMTTDTVPKVVHHQGCIGDWPYQITAIAKGAGMIRPDMATLLAFVLTDISAGSDQLYKMFHQAVDRSLNCMTIDGDTSTNDTALIMASGMSEVGIDRPQHRKTYQSALNDVMWQLARLLVNDGEGVTKLVDISVKGAGTDANARTVADTVAHSSLVKTAFYGEDANWGRILAAVGRSGVRVTPEKIDIYFDRVQMVKNGFGCGTEAEAEVTKVLKQDAFTVTIDLNAGRGKALVLTSDLSIEYVKINADYRT